MTDAEFRRLSVPELLALEARWKVEERRRDARAAIVAHTVAVALIGRKDGKTWRVEDFMPQTGKPEEEEQGVEEMLGVMMGLVSDGDDR